MKARKGKSKSHTIRVKRVYEPAAPEDGARILVDRLWPRGLKKEVLQLHSWLKEAAPSNALRTWFNHKPARWPEFRQRYFAELDAHPEVLQPIFDAATRGSVTLLFSAKSTELNNAVVLAEYCQREQR